MFSSFQEILSFFSAPDAVTRNTLMYLLVLALDALWLAKSIRMKPLGLAAAASMISVGVMLLVGVLDAIVVASNEVIATVIYRSNREFNFELLDLHAYM
jgi:hypothetical protein